MKVLITGGAGFIGSHLTEALGARGDELTVIDCFDDAYDPARKRRRMEGSKARLIEGDIRDRAVLRGAMEGAEVVVHMAARAGVRESLENPDLYTSVNVDGTQEVIDAVVAQGKARLVFCSSSSVYGSRTDGPFRETDDVEVQASPYAWTKREGERRCWAAHEAEGLDVAVMRLFTVYGPRQRPGMAIARFVRLAREGRSLPLFGDGSSMRDYTYVADTVAGLVAAIDHARGWELLNLGSGAPISLRGLIGEIGRVLGHSVTVQHLPLQEGDVPLTHADITVAREVLGWHPLVDLHEGLRHYAHWAKTTGEDA